MRIAIRIHVHIAGGQFEELRELCTAAGDKASLAIGMAGLFGDFAFHDRICEASELASEAMDLIESIGDPTLTVGLALMAIYAKLENAEWSDVLRWSQAVIDLADGDPSIGGLIFGSPLPIAVGVRGIARYHLGRVGWREDVQHGLAMARSAEPYSAQLPSPDLQLGNTVCVLAADDPAMREIEDALQNAERFGDDLGAAIMRMTLGNALVHRHTAAEHDRGQQLLAELSDVFLRNGQTLGEVPLVNVYAARVQARRGDLDDAIPIMRAATDHVFREGRVLALKFL